MKTTITSFQVEQFRRDAKRLARNTAASLSQTLDQIAASNGFVNWSQLVRQLPADKDTEKRSARPIVRARFYVHGDQVETDPSMYYCAQCDLFVAATHFVSQHGVKTYDFALHHIERWQYAAAKHLYRPPENAVNILEAEARRRNAEKEARRSSFHRWLEGQKGRNDPIGDFAQDVLGDPSFPTTATTLSELQEYRQFRPWVTQTLNQAWSEFSRAV